MVSPVSETASLSIRSASSEMRVPNGTVISRLRVLAWAAVPPFVVLVASSDSCLPRISIGSMRSSGAGLGERRAKVAGLSLIGSVIG